jgi:succinylglutamate desuccinylase
MLEIRHELPPEFFTLSASDLHKHFRGPTIVHLPGKRNPPVFISIVLHGNEDVGLKAIQVALNQYSNQSLPRELILFIGNTEAAQQGLRKLPHQLDFNRVWPGTDLPPSPISEYMSSVVDHVKKLGVFVSVDLHNNTGANPHYGCINRVDAKTLQLATLFSRTVVYFKRPLGVQSGAMAELCPSITCECGKVGDASGVERAARLIEACLQMLELPEHYPQASDYHLLRTVATIKVNPRSSFCFSGSSTTADLVLPYDLTQLNFRPLSSGTVLGQQQPGCGFPLIILSEKDEDITGNFLSSINDQIVLNRPAIPSMLTNNSQVIRDDCLGYFMEEFDTSR